MEKSLPFDKIAFYILAGFVILIPIFFVPTTYFGFLYSKIGLLSVTVFLASIILLIKLIYKGEAVIPKATPFLITFAVPFFVAVSSLLSHSPVSGLIARGTDITTLYFVGLCFLLLALCAVYFQDKQKTLIVYLGFLGIFAVMALFSFLRFIFGVHFLSFGLFTSIVNNTVGSWEDLGIYSGIAVILSLITLEFMSFERLPRIGLSAVLAAGLILTSFANSYILFNFFGFYVPLTALIAVFAGILFVYRASLGYLNKNKKFKVPVFSLVVLIVSIVSTIWASPIARGFYSYENVAPTDVNDVRPTLASTYEVATKVIMAGVQPALVGVGPNRFFSVWSEFKPAEINQSDSWNIDFNYGVGYLSTMLVTTGILGFLAWACFIFYFLYLVLRILVKGVKDQFSLYLILSSSSLALYLWCVEFFYITGPTVLILAFVFSGITVASIVREKGLALYTFSWSGSHKKAMAALIVIIVLIIGMLVAFSAWIDRTIASVSEERAVYASQASDYTSAENDLLSSINRDPADVYLNIYAQIKLSDLQKQLSATRATTLDATTGTTYNDALTAAIQAARDADAYNYENWIFLGNVYEVGAELGVSNSANYAMDAFIIAEQLAPQSPLPFFLRGQLYALGHDYPDAKTQLNYALSLRSNYTDAKTLLDQVNAAPAAQVVAAATSKTASSTSSTATSTSKK